VAFSPDQTRGSYRVFSLKRLSAFSARIVERRFEFLRGGATCDRPGRAGAWGGAASRVAPTGIRDRRGIPSANCVAAGAARAASIEGCHRNRGALSGSAQGRIFGGSPREIFDPSAAAASLLPAPGHTPGHSAVAVSSGRDSVLHVADAVLHPILMEQPAWRTVFDLEQDRAAETRRRLLDRAAADKTKVMAYHFPFPTLGRVASRPAGGSQWEPAS
jgi:hypothetical protein